MHSQPHVMDTINTKEMSEVSGMAVGTDGHYIFTCNDSPGGDARVFAFDKKTMRRTIIEIRGVRDIKFNPDRSGKGYGDWEAMAITHHPKDERRRVILVGDIGQNKARGLGGKMRSPHQQTRFIMIDEPSQTELNTARKNNHGFYCIEKPGTEYPFQFTSENLQYDCEAMAVVGDMLLVITKNKARTNLPSFIYGCRLKHLNPNTMTTFSLIGQMRISISEVTDAFAADNILALRTYRTLNLYRIADLRPGKFSEAAGTQMLNRLNKKDAGQQEAMAFDERERCIYFLGEGSSKMFTMEFEPNEALQAALEDGKQRKRHRQGRAIGNFFSRLRRFF